MIAFAGCLALPALTAAAGATPITLLSPNTSASPPPPLAGGQQLSSEPGEVRVPGTLANMETVRVGLGPDGTPSSVVVLQRMSLRGLGDFRFVIPAPATDVVPGAGSQSMPGLRQAGIVWQGFSPGRRVLSARITLRALDAAPGLPIRVSVERRNGITRVRLENETAKQFAITLGSAPVPGLQVALAHVRSDLGRQLAAGRPLPLVPEQVQGQPSKQVLLSVETAVHVTGTVSVAGARTARIDTMLGGGRPRARVVQVLGGGRPTISLQVSFDPDRRTLLPTATALAAAAHPLRALQIALARTAVSLQYQQYLASPKPDGASTTTYDFRTVRVAARPSGHLVSGGDGGTSALAIALGVIGGIAALGGLTVLWAHL